MNKVFKIIGSILDYDERNKILNNFNCDYNKDISEDAFELYEYLRHFHPNISYFHGLTRMVIIIPDCKYVIKIPFRGVYKGNKFFRFRKDYCKQEYQNYSELSSLGFGKFFAETSCLNLSGYTFEFQEKCLPWKEFQHNISKTDMEKAIQLKKKFINFNADIDLPYTFIAELIKAYGENEVESLFIEAGFYNPDLLNDMNIENFGFRVSDGTPCIFDFSNFEKNDFIKEEKE